MENAASVVQPGGIDVTYICNEGYHLNSSVSTSSCMYDYNEAGATAVWSSAEVIGCKRGEWYDLTSLSSVSLLYMYIISCAWV